MGVDRFSALRVARPVRELARAERFWVGGLGLEVLFRAGEDAEGGHALLMVGWPGAAWHLELVEAPSAVIAPGEEDLLVLYAGEPISEGLVARLLECGGVKVRSGNPYWERWGVTVADPDGYRLVLSSRVWP